MTTVLNIAGHGLKPDGSFDPGAKGLITKGEHKYMVEDFFPAMKRHIPNDSKLKFEFYTKRNVLHYGDIVSLANSYGKDTIVIEYHYDAFTATAKGGHVIIWHKFKPDSLDLRLRDAIGSMVGLRFEHMGQKGISGRDNLGNARMTANGGVNYRLLELGFGTNKDNAKVMTENIDEYAKKVVEAILNTNVADKPKEKYKPEPTPAPVIKSKTIDQMAQEVIAGKHGNGHTTRRKSLGISQAEYDKVSAKVNAHYGVKSAAKPTLKSLDSISREVIDGKWGNGNDREKRLNKAGYNADKVQAKVNQLLSGG
ncbi:MAG: N-acetylmuramoyl-L-alanine amidase, partial [Tetragenococcus halophilus]|nr:N-acetylmuramoyl-L-alanine amidase [Tetragenococcus halophilus]